MKYIKPEKEKESFTCPFCHTLSTFSWNHMCFQEDINYCISSNEPNKDVYIGRCLNCRNKVLWIDDNYVYPDIQPLEPNPEMPNSVLQLYNEAGLIFNKSPRAACALLRLAIEKLCNELGECNGNIDKDIANLVRKGLPVDIQQALDIVRVVGNKAVHPGQISFDVDSIEEVNILFNIINVIVERLISEPNRLDYLYNQLPESIRQNIIKRDNKE